MDGDFIKWPVYLRPAFPSDITRSKCSNSNLDYFCRPPMIFISSYNFSTADGYITKNRYASNFICKS